MNPLYVLFSTSKSWTPSLLRLAAAFILFIHSAQRILGWFGGRGYVASMAMLTAAEGWGLPHFIAAVAMFSELLLAVGLLTGFLTRPAALALIALILLRILFGSSGLPPLSDELLFLLTQLIIALALVVSGGGNLSIDRLAARGLLP